MKFFGLTGGIGAGKSTVSSMLSSRGFHIVDADQIAREVVEPGQPAFSRLVEHFGESVLKEDGVLNRPYIASIVFNDTRELQFLNEITHQAIYQRSKVLIQEHIHQDSECHIIYDAAILFENQLNAFVQKTILVVVDEALQIQRLVELRGLSKKDALARMKNQMPQDEKKKMSDYIIENNGTLENTQTQVEGLIRKLADVPHIQARECVFLSS